MAPVPFSSSVYFFTEALIKYANEEIKKDVLPKLVSGEIVGTYGIAEDHRQQNQTYQVTVTKEKLMDAKLQCLMQASQRI